MCIPIGVAFRCDCEWIVWANCADVGGDCTVKALHPNNRPPTTIAKPTDLASKRKYITLCVRDHQFVLKVTRCCSPECCASILAPLVPVQGTSARDQRKYHHEATKHLEICCPKFIDGFGMLNCMENDIGRLPRLGKPFRVDTSQLTGRKYTTLNDLALRDYRKLYRTNGGLQSARFATRSSVEQYLSIRIEALSDPTANLISSGGGGQPTQVVLMAFRALQARYGIGSRQAAQVAIDWNSSEPIVSKLYTLGGKDSRTVEDILAKRKPALPIIPAPTSVGARASANRETFKEMERAIHQLATRVVSVHDVQANAFLAEVRQLEVDIQNGNRLDCDMTLLRARLYDTLALMTPQDPPPTVPPGPQQMNPNPLPQYQNPYLPGAAGHHASYGQAPQGPGLDVQHAGSGLGAGQFGSSSYGSGVTGNPASQYGPQSFPTGSLAGYGNPYGQPSAQSHFPTNIPPAMLAQDYPRYAPPTSQAQAQAQYQQILNEVRTIGPLPTTFLAPRLEREAIDGLKARLAGFDDRIMNVYSAVQEEAPETANIGEAIERIIWTSRDEIRNREISLRGGIGAPPMQGSAYGPGYPTQGGFGTGGGQGSGSGYGGSFGGENPYGSGYKSSTGQAGRGNGHGKGSTESLMKTKKPLPPDTVKPMSLPTRTKTSNLQLPGADTSDQISVATIDSNITKSTAKSKAPGDNEPVSSLPGQKKASKNPSSSGYGSDSADSGRPRPSGKKEGRKDKDAGGLMKSIFKSPFKSPRKDKEKKK